MHISHSHPHFFLLKRRTERQCQKEKKKEFENVSHQVLVEDNVIIIQQRPALLDRGSRYSDQMTNSRKQNLFFPSKNNKGVRNEPTGLGSMLNEVGSSMISWVVCSILDMRHVVLRAFQRGWKRNRIKEESMGPTTPGH